MILGREFYARDALAVAVDLIGATIVRDDVILRITEVEAYRWLGADGSVDTANHSRIGKTARNAAMWGPPGRTYVYLCYGLHWMLNLVADHDGQASAVLIRGAEIVAGHGTVRGRRGGRDDLVGPGKVGAALGLDRSWNEHAVYEAGGLEVHAPSLPARVAFGPRIGIDYADPEHRDAPWRVGDAASKAVARRSALIEGGGGR